MVKDSKFIHLYNTQAEHDADYTHDSENYIEPWVAYTVQTEEVTYNLTPIDWSQEYLTFKALEDGTFTLTVPSGIDSTYMTSISYSLNNGETWVDTTVDNTAQTITTPTVNAGGKVLWKGVGNSMAQYTTSNYTAFSSTGEFNVMGNIMSLLYGDNFEGIMSFPSNTSLNFACLFMSANKLLSAKNLILPVTSLTRNCYDKMFQHCTSLTSVPELPVMTAVYSCYNGMFSGCSALTAAPALPATTLGQSCYGSMFQGCTSLTTAPELPATTLATSCYSQMFSGCTSLTTAPALLATTLAWGCYYGMFNGCTLLTYIKAMFTTTPSTTYTNGWVSGVAATGTFVKNSAAQWDVSGSNGIPQGWTVETASE